MNAYKSMQICPGFPGLFVAEDVYAAVQAPSEERVDPQSY
jgi:hypothetical protein